MRTAASFTAAVAMWAVAIGAASGHGATFGFYVGVPGWWGLPPVAYPYAGYYPYYPPPYYPAYPYPRYYPFAVYPPPRPPAYVERRPVVAHPPPAPARREKFTLSAQELFAFDRDELRMPQPKLDEIARTLVANPQIKTVAITGYTDRLGTDAYNLALSQRRADAVKSYLANKGVAASRLVAVGRGNADPVVRCPETDRATLIRCLEPNRRVEVEPITVERRIG